MYRILGLVFIFEVWILAFFTPHDFDIQNPKNDKSIILTDFQIERYIDLMLQFSLRGESGYVFTDGRYKATSISVNFRKDDIDENISSDEVFFDTNDMELSGNVTYKRSDGLIIKSAKVLYDIENRYFYIPGNVTMKKSGSIDVSGENLIIDRVSGKVKINNIGAKLKNLN